MSQSRETIIQELGSLIKKHSNSGISHKLSYTMKRWELELVADYILSRTPPPASMKFPDMKPESKFPYADNPVHMSNEGWNDCLKACKELNAVKGDIPSKNSMEYLDYIEKEGDYKSSEHCTCDIPQINHNDTTRIVGSTCIKCSNKITLKSFKPITETPKFTGNPGKNEAITTNKLTYCKHKILEPHCDECFPDTSEKKECKELNAPNVEDHSKLPPARKYNKFDEQPSEKKECQHQWAGTADSNVIFCTKCDQRRLA